jgi:hypothetical protein
VADADRDVLIAFLRTLAAVHVDRWMGMFEERRNYSMSANWG